ncbi:MAG: non-ribosomal peptide synthetase, partial [Comamonadaceae bacterium]
GFRIELGEIEAALRGLPQVLDAVVLAREDQPGDKRLVAYLVAEEGELDVYVLREALGRSLPAYMVPAHVMQLPGMPLTPNGKLDKRALPAPDAIASEEQYVAPRTDTEALLAPIWAEVLKVERVGMHDNFFALGGHSLLAIQLIERMRQAGVASDVRTLFGAPTPALLAEVAGNIQAGDAPQEIVVPPNGIPPAATAITPRMLTLVTLDEEEIEAVVRAVPGGAANVQDIYPLVPLQEGILFHHMMHRGGDAYMLSLRLAFDNRGRLDDFLGALQKVIDRHDVLRTAVLWDGLPQPVQVVWRKAPLVVEEVALDEAQLAQGLGAMEQLEERFSTTHYRLDVTKAPLLRACIAQERAGQEPDEQSQPAKGGRWIMHLLSHHLATDHTTEELLIREIRLILQGRDDLLPAPVPFRNFVARAKLGMSEQEHEAFFNAMLDDVEQPTAPFGLLDVQGDGSDIEEFKLDVDEALAGRLRAQARQLGVTAASVIHLAWARVVAMASGQQDVVFGTVLFGRLQGGEGVGQTIGMLLNTLPLRVPVGSQDVVQAVRQTHGLLAGLMRHEYAPLALAQRCSRLETGTPLFSALLNYRHVLTEEAGEHGPQEGHATSGGQAGDEWLGMQQLGAHERTNYPFTLMVDDFGDGFRLMAQIGGGIRAAKVCEYMHTALDNLARALETEPQRAVNTIEVMSDAEWNQILVGWNDTSVEFER